MTVREPVVLERNWGREIVVAWTPTHAGKVLHRKAGTVGGFQCHIKEESHYLFEGRLLLRMVQNGAVVEQIVEAGQAWTVPPLFVHQEEALTDCVLFEVSDPTTEDRYGLIPDPGALSSMTDGVACQKLNELEQALRQRADDCLVLRDAIAAEGLINLLREERAAVTR